MIRRPLVIPGQMQRISSPNRTEIAKRMPLAGLGPVALPASVRFVFLCFTNRCGSAYLGDLLYSTGIFESAGETLNADAVLEAMNEHGVRSFTDYFERIVRRDSKDDMYIVKVAAEQLVLLIESGMLDQIVERSDFLFLNRADKLAQAISRAIAQQNNRWAWNSPVQVPDDELVYSFERIAQHIDDITILNLCFERFFASNGIVPITVEYERLVDDPSREIDEIGRRLRLPSLNPVIDKVRYRRQANEINQSWRSRFLLDAQAVASRSPPTAIGVAADVVVHVRNVGDVQGQFGAWIGTPASGLWIEGIRIIPGRGMVPEDIEYCGVEDFGRASAWMSGGVFCGTRGKGLPLRGLAVRLRNAAAETYQCSYSARFAGGSTVGPLAAGELCRSASLAPLEAVQIVIHPRQGRRDGNL